MKQGYVYLLEAEDSYKVGNSVNYDLRCKNLAAEVGKTLKCLYAYKTNESVKLERKVLDALKPYKIDGEWFCKKQIIIDTYLRICSENALKDYDFDDNHPIIHESYRQIPSPKSGYKPILHWSQEFGVSEKTIRRITSRYRGTELIKKVGRKIYISESAVSHYKDKYNFESNQSDAQSDHIKTLKERIEYLKELNENLYQENKELRRHLLDLALPSIQRNFQL